MIKVYVSVDERYPDFSVEVVNDINEKWFVEIDEKLFKKILKAEKEYAATQEILKKLQKQQHDK